jgi:hypothetical protein
LPPVNLDSPGWKIQQGQAVWKQKKAAPELAGEILFATNSDGRALLQFTKTPFPFVIAQKTPTSWQLEIPAQNKKYSGPGTPPSRISWFHLMSALNGQLPKKPWTFQKMADDNWRLENKKTGETVEGFLSK